MAKRLKLFMAVLIATTIAVGCTRPVRGQEQPILQPTYCEQAHDACFPLSGPRTYASPKEYLYAKAGADAPLLDRIIQCESGYQAEIKNKNSSATGLAQFISSTWISSRRGMGLSEDLELRKNPYESIDTMLWLYKQAGTQPWSESRSCWQTYNIK